MRRARTNLPLVALALAALACSPPPTPAPVKKAPPPVEAGPAGPSAAEAKAFVDEVDKELRALYVASSVAEWEKNTNITDATEAAAAKANEKVMEYMGATIKRAGEFAGVADLDPDTARKLHLIRVSASPPPAPSDPAKREELASLGAKMDGLYGKGKACETRGKKEVCRDLGQLEDVLAHSRKYDELLAAWSGWHRIAREIRPLYTRFVALANEGAKEIGYDDLGVLWRAGYDMSPDAFEAETNRLWAQVAPLYEQLHCHVRAELGKKYGADKVPQGGLIPAHLLGNMWAQEWGNIYPLVTPFPGTQSLDITKALVAEKYDEKKLVRLGESFFTSLGLDPLPDTFWERSMFQKPKDREVVCHASAWDVDFNNDLRIKMCIKINEEDLVTVHHELGHNYYYHYYYQLPVLYQQGAHDGFHEAIGDALALSVTPAYLEKIGLVTPIKGAKSDQALINLQMQNALDKIAFLPFGRLIDQWRWDVFAGKIPASEYNAGWWALRAKYQGLAPPAPRTEDDFDPGAKYHVPANVPYTRYFLARILQFQFHKALCQAAGHTGPLHECSIYGSKEAGAKLQAMLELGASKPWPDALEAMTGSREMDASALIEYFGPLEAWLKEQNQGRTCGWSAAGG